MIKVILRGLLMTCVPDFFFFFLFSPSFSLWPGNPVTDFPAALFVITFFWWLFMDSSYILSLKEDLLSCDSPDDRDDLLISAALDLFLSDSQFRLLFLSVFM